MSQEVIDVSTKKVAPLAVLPAWEHQDTPEEAAKPKTVKPWHLAALEQAVNFGDRYGQTAAAGAAYRPEMGPKTIAGVCCSCFAGAFVLALIGIQFWQFQDTSNFSLVLGPDTEITGNYDPDEWPGKKGESGAEARYAKLLARGYANRPTMFLPTLLADFTVDIQFFEDAAPGSLQKVEVIDNTGYEPYWASSLKDDPPGVQSVVQDAQVPFESFDEELQQFSSPKPPVDFDLRELLAVQATHEELAEPLKAIYAQTGVIGSPEQFFAHQAHLFVRFRENQLSKLKSCQLQAYLFNSGVSAWLKNANPDALKDRESQTEAHFPTLTSSNATFNPDNFPFTISQGYRWKHTLNRGSELQVIHLSSNLSDSQISQLGANSAHGPKRLNLTAATIKPPAAELMSWKFGVNYVNNFMHINEEYWCDSAEVTYYARGTPLQNGTVAELKCLDPERDFDEEFHNTCDLFGNNLLEASEPFYVVITSIWGVENARVIYTNGTLERASAATTDHAKPAPGWWTGYGGGYTPEDPKKVGWRCNPVEYHRRDKVCDCECGAYDPDCGEYMGSTFQEIRNCNPSEFCSFAGHCMPTDPAELAATFWISMDDKMETDPNYWATFDWNKPVTLPVHISQRCEKVSMPGQEDIRGFVGTATDMSKFDSGSCPGDILYNHSAQRTSTGEYVCYTESSGILDVALMETMSEDDEAPALSQLRRSDGIRVTVTGASPPFPSGKGNLTVMLDAENGNSERLTAWNITEPDANSTQTMFLSRRGTKPKPRFSHLSKGVLLSAIDGSTSLIYVLTDPSYDTNEEGVPQRRLTDAYNESASDIDAYNESSDALPPSPPSPLPSPLPSPSPSPLPSPSPSPSPSLSPSPSGDGDGGDGSFSYTNLASPSTNSRFVPALNFDRRGPYDVYVHDPGDKLRIASATPRTNAKMKIQSLELAEPSPFSVGMRSYLVTQAKVGSNKITVRRVGFHKLKDHVPFYLTISRGLGVEAVKVTAVDGSAAAWTCADEHYAGSDGCQCGCGIWDPDCGTDPRQSGSERPFQCPSQTSASSASSTAWDASEYSEYGGDLDASEYGGAMFFEGEISTAYCLFDTYGPKTTANNLPWRTRCVNAESGLSAYPSSAYTMRDLNEQSLQIFTEQLTISASQTLGHPGQLLETYPYKTAVSAAVSYRRDYDEVRVNNFIWLSSLVPVRMLREGVGSFSPEKRHKPGGLENTESPEMLQTTFALFVIPDRKSFADANFSLCPTMSTAKVPPKAYTQHGFDKWELAEDRKMRLACRSPQQFNSSTCLAPSAYKAKWNSSYRMECLSEMPPTATFGYTTTQHVNEKWKGRNTHTSTEATATGFRAPEKNLDVSHVFHFSHSEDDEDVERRFAAGRKANGDVAQDGARHYFFGAPFYRGKGRNGTNASDAGFPANHPFLRPALRIRVAPSAVSDIQRARPIMWHWQSEKLTEDVVKKFQTIDITWDTSTVGGSAGQLLLTPGYQYTLVAEVSLWPIIRRPMLLADFFEHYEGFGYSVGSATVSQHRLSSLQKRQAIVHVKVGFSTAEATVREHNMPFENFLTGASAAVNYFVFGLYGLWCVQILLRKKTEYHEWALKHQAEVEAEVVKETETK